METITIKMGEVYASNEPVIIQTLGIGSCVVITMYDENKKIGGMAHAMLPEDRGSAIQIESHPLRYVEQAINAVMEECEKMGTNKSSLKATLTGGAQMFSFYTQRNEKPIGPANVEAAKKKLKTEGIRITNSATGGTVGRNVSFNMETNTCDVTSKM